jgi:hypothetical protein
MQHREGRVENDRYLDPEYLRPTLVAAAVFVLSFETLRTTMIEWLETFYSDGWNEDGPILGEEFEREVASRSKDPSRAALGRKSTGRSGALAKRPAVRIMQS